MDIRDSARKHGIADPDIRHALDYAVRYQEIEYDGELRILVIGMDTRNRVLELILVPANEPARIIHADLLRPSRYQYL